MRTKIISYLMIIGFLVIFYQFTFIENNNTEANSKYTSVGDTIAGSFIHEDSTRNYILYAPKGYDGSKKLPLVIVYHGFGMNAETQMNWSQMNVVADTANFLVVYPEGLTIYNPFLQKTGPGWNVLGLFSKDFSDITFSSKLIAEIDQNYSIDKERIFATGFSLGSNLTFQLGCELSDQIAAVAGVAGQMATPQLENCNPSRPNSMLLIQGTEDPIVPFNGDGAIIPPATKTPSFWAKQNGCLQDSLVTNLANKFSTDSSTVTLIHYNNCNINSEVLFYRINGGGHTWPGGGDHPAVLGSLNQDITASVEIWNFFSRHSLKN